MKIFYSWQLDADRRINKDFIHDALSDAITSINDNIEISEADRIEGPLILDQDTKGVLGSPPIVERYSKRLQVRMWSLWMYPWWQKVEKKSSISTATLQLSLAMLLAREGMSLCSRS